MVVGVVDRSGCCWLSGGCFWLVIMFKKVAVVVVVVGYLVVGRGWSSCSRRWRL